MSAPTLAQRLLDNRPATSGAGQTDDFGAVLAYLLEADSANYGLRQIRDLYENQDGILMVLWVGDPAAHELGSCVDLQQMLSEALEAIDRDDEFWRSTLEAACVRRIMDWGRGDGLVYPPDA